MQVFENVQACVEPDEVNHLERAHRVVEAELHRFINIRSRGDALLQHVKRLIAYHGVDAAGDKTGRLFDSDSLFSHAATHLNCRRNRIGISFQPSHNFEQLHLVHRIEEVHAQALGRAVGHGRDFSDAER